MRRTVVSLCSLAALAVLGTGCGGGENPSADASREPSEPSSSSPSASALPPGCSPPSGDVEYTAGSASFDVTAGPDQGNYELELDPSSTNEFAASDKEITGNWVSADGKAVLFIDIEGVDPCEPDAFTRIGTQGSAGPVFIDSMHTDCVVKLQSLGAAGAQGTFACKGLVGGGEGLERDADGTFTLLP